MGRKKKQVEQTVVSKKDSISYQGAISVSIVNGNRTLLKKKYHNKGMLNLFRFIANCLAGNKAEHLRPVKIKLFNYRGASGIAPSQFKWDGNDSAWSDPDKSPVNLTPYIMYDAAPVIKEEDESYTVTLHFRVPLSYIAGDTINLIGLYRNDAVNDRTEISAYYLLADLTEDKWTPIELDNVTSNYSLIMEWVLSISNKTAQ